MDLETQIQGIENTPAETSPATSTLRSGDETARDSVHGSGEAHPTFIGSSSDTVASLISIASPNIHSGIHLVRSALECAQQDYSNLETPSESAEVRHTFPERQRNNDRVALPLREMANSLKDTFFSHYQVQYPILNQEEFEHTMSQFYDTYDGRSSISDSLHDDVWIRFMINMVLAIPLISMAGNHEQSHALSKGLTANAMADVSLIMQTKNVQSLQCLLLLLLLSILDSSPAPVWYISGLCMRMCIDLGYHSERTISMSSSVDLNEVHTEEEADTKRRLFWVTYSFDRTFNILLGRPFTFDDLSVDINLPGCSLTPNNRRQTLHWLELQRLQSEIVHKLHTTREVANGREEEESELELSQWTDEKAQSLKDWNRVAQTLADPYGYDVNWWGYWYRTALLILYRPSLLRPNLSTSDSLSCYKAIKDLIQLSFLRISEGLADFTWVDLHFQFMSGITMILIIWKNVEVRDKAKEDWVSLKSSLFQWKLILERLGTRWERIGRAREVLSKLADATVDLVERDLTRSAGGTLQPQPSQGKRETRHSQRRSIIMRLHELSQQGPSHTTDHQDSNLACANVAFERNFAKPCNSNRNLQGQAQGEGNSQGFSTQPTAEGWTNFNAALHPEILLDPQAARNCSHQETEEVLWPLLDLSDITAGPDELNLWAYFSAPMLGVESTAITSFNAGTRPDEFLNNSILNFQGDLSNLTPQVGADNIEEGDYIQRLYAG
jgi:hypothetical protein